MSAPEVVRMQWLETADGELRDHVYDIVAAVMELGGAVGWLGVPTRAEADAWLDGLLDSIGAGNSRLAMIRGDGGAGPVLALGRWTRYDKPAVSLNAEILQLMVHPAARGRRLARMLLRALVADAGRHGIETLTLDVRGNNHAAMALYESEHFEVYGRLPDFVAVGRERWDRVLYRRDLRTGPGSVRRHGGRPVGPGSSELRAPSGHTLFDPPPLSDPGSRA